MSLLFGLNGSLQQGTFVDVNIGWFVGYNLIGLQDLKSEEFFSGNGISDRKSGLNMTWWFGGGSDEVADWLQSAAAGGTKTLLCQYHYKVPLRIHKIQWFSI